MQSLTTTMCLAVMLAASGCAVTPVGGPAYGVGGAYPMAVVRPAYPMPAPRYVWQMHPNYGWGWHHPEFGWHRGW